MSAIATEAPSAARRATLAWCVYDMAAHGYILMIAGVAFPVYFAAYVADVAGKADMLWSIALAIPLLLAGIAGPWVGALADASGHRRALLAAATIVCSLATALLAFVGRGEVMFGIALFTVAHFAHLLATSLYNAYLPFVAAPGRLARVSGMAWGLSYLGSLACFALCLPFTRDGLATANIANFTSTFPATAAFLALVGLPAVMLLPADTRGSGAKGRSGPYRRILATLSEWRRDRNLPMLLLAYYLVNDGLVAVVFFTALTFRHTFGLDVLQILSLSLLVQLVAIPSTIGFGWLGDRWSQRGAIYGTLTLWLVALILMVRTDGWNGAIAVSAALGLVLGSTQSLFRSLFAAMVPVDRAAEFFGFHTLVGRAAAAFAPLVFGAVSVATGSQRTAMASLAVFFVAGAAVLARVRVPER